MVTWNVQICIPKEYLSVEVEVSKDCESYEFWGGIGYVPSTEVSIKKLEIYPAPRELKLLSYSDYEAAGIYTGDRKNMNIHFSCECRAEDEDGFCLWLEDIIPHGWYIDDYEKKVIH